MKKFLSRAEHAVLRLLVRPELRPLEHAALSALARSLAVRFGLSSAALALVVELIDRFVR